MNKRFENPEDVCQVGVKMTKQEMIELKRKAHENYQTVPDFVRSRTLEN